MGGFIIMVLKRSTLAGGSSSSGAVGNDFLINTGTSGNTTVTLSKEFPAGDYVIVSSLGDTSYDIYLVATDGSAAGSVNSTTAQTTVTATKAFTTVVVYGTSNNDTFNFTFKYVFAPSADSSSLTSVGPRITSLSTSTLAKANDTTNVSGKNFASDVAVTFTGSDGVARNAKSVVRNSATSLTVTRPDDMPNSYQPYTMTVSNPGIASPTSTNLHKIGSIGAGSVPVWTTSAGDLSTIFVKGSAYSHTIAATDADAGSAITYSIVSGALPTGISLNSSTGALTGTSSSSFGVYNFTVRATDAGGNYVDRAFAIQNFVSVDSDTFDRSTSGNLGSTSNKATVWTNVRGTWSANGSQATSGDSAGTNAIATVTAATTNISNLQVDTLGTGGVGPAFWVTDSGSWWATTTWHSTSSGTTTGCTGGYSGLYEGSCPSMCNQCNGCDTSVSRYYVMVTCNDGQDYGETLRTGCTASAATIANWCSYAGGGYSNGCRGPYTFYSCPTTAQTVAYTNYNSNFRLVNSSGVQVNTQYNTNGSSYSSAGSLAVSTVGDVITYSVYSGANKSGLLHSGTYTATGATKGRGVGVYKGDGGSNQGSSVDNFSVTVI
jgi:hypothetical protein